MSADQRPTRRVLDLADANPLAVDMGAAGVLLFSPLAIKWVHDAVVQAVRQQTSAGYPVPPPLRDLAAVLHRPHEDNLGHVQAALSSTNAVGGNAAVPQDPDGATSVTDELIGVEDAARLLGLQARQVRNLVPQLGGRKVGRTWQFDVLAVSAMAAEQREGAA